MLHDCLDIYYVAGVVIQGPSIVIYFPGQSPVQLACKTSAGIIGWSINDSLTITPGDINTRKGHSLNGTKLVIDNPINNTKYVCISIRSTLNLRSDPVFLFVAGNLMHCMCMCMLKFLMYFCVTCII